MFNKKEKTNTLKRVCKIEFSPKGVKCDGEIIDYHCQFNHVPEYLFGETKMLNSLDLHDYIIQLRLLHHAQNPLVGFEKKTNKKVIFFQFIGFTIQDLAPYFVLSLVLKTPGLVKFIGIYIPEKSNKFQIPPENNQTNESITISDPMLAWEYLENGNAFTLVDNYLSGSDDKLNPTIRCKIIYGIAAIMNYVHKKGFVHLCLSTSCIFLDDNFEPKISGFKYTNPHCNKYDEVLTPCSPIFISPEIIECDENYIGPPSDVYSYGMIVYRMFSKEFLGFERIRSEFLLRNKILAGVRPERPKNIPDFYWDLIEHCWDQSTLSRPSFENILRDIKSHDFTLEEFGMKTDVKSIYEYQDRMDKLYKIHDSEEKELSFVGSDGEQYIEEVEQIGEGDTSVVYKVFDTRTKKTMCKKVIKLKEETAFKNVQNAIKEFEFLVSFHHPCICQAIGLNTSEKVKGKKDQTTIAIYLEYYKYNLKNFLRETIINNTIKARIAVEVAFAMSFIHKHNMIHRDLKAENIMLNDAFEVKLIDFGLIKIDEMLLTNYSFVGSTLTKGVGTFDYMSPEMLNEEDYDSMTDVYSYGILLYFIFTGSVPHMNLKDKLNGKKIQLPKESENISSFCIDLISRCLSFRPYNRPTFSQILVDMKDNSYQLASTVDASIIDRRYNELRYFNAENYYNK